MPKLSIIVPVYRVEAYIEKCIDSILAQAFSDFELILVDDGSPDRCPEICDAYAQEHPNIKVIHQPNGGLSDARNAGLDIAVGEYIGFVDSDDYIHRDMYRTMVAEMEQTDSDMVICDHYVVDQQKVSVYAWYKETCCMSHHGIMRAILADTIGSQAWNKLYKRALFEGIRYPVGRLFEDIPTTYRYVDRCRRVRYIKTPLYYYNLRNEGISLKRNRKTAWHIYLGFRDRYEYTKQYCPQFSDIALPLVVKHGIDLIKTSMIKEQDADPALQGIHMYLKEQMPSVRKCASIKLIRKMECRLILYHTGLYRKLYQIIRHLNIRNRA